jgi:hypothetical protein
MCNGSARFEVFYLRFISNFLQSQNILCRMTTMQPANRTIAEETRQAVTIFYALGQYLRQLLEPVDEDMPS